MVRLLLHNALRVDEACTADLASLGEDKGHRVLTVMGKGNRKVKVPLPPGTCGALDAYLADTAPQQADKSRPRTGRAAALLHTAR